MDQRLSAYFAKHHMLTWVFTLRAHYTNFVCMLEAELISLDALFSNGWTNKWYFNASHYLHYCNSAWAPLMLSACHFSGEQMDFIQSSQNQITKVIKYFKLNEFNQHVKWVYLEIELFTCDQGQHSVWLAAVHYEPLEGQAGLYAAFAEYETIQCYHSNFYDLNKLPFLLMLWIPFKIAQPWSTLITEPSLNCSVPLCFSDESFKLNATVSMFKAWNELYSRRNSSVYPWG